MDGVRVGIGVRAVEGVCNRFSPPLFGTRGVIGEGFPVGFASLIGFYRAWLVGAVGGGFREMLLTVPSVAIVTVDVEEEAEQGEDQENGDGYGNSNCDFGVPAETIMLVARRSGRSDGVGALSWQGRY